MDEEYNSESDDDYVPSGEYSSDKDSASDDGNENGKFNVSKRKNRRHPKTRKFLKLDNEDENNSENTDNENNSVKDNISDECQKVKEEQEKKHADDLWNRFLSDVGPKAKSRTSTVVQVTKESLTIKNSDSLNITKTFEYAGELIKKSDSFKPPSKDITVDKPSDNKNASLSVVSETRLDLPNKPSPILDQKKKIGGLSVVLGKINKPTKLSCLDKSKLDWDSFKQTHQIEEELRTHNKGKDGYIEQKRFLERTDLRQFEIEKHLRLSNKKL